MKFGKRPFAVLAVALLATSVASAQHRDHAAAPDAKDDHADHAAAHSESGPGAIIASVMPASGLKVGVPTTFTLSLTSKDGKPVTHADLQVAHTEKVHLLIVDPSLSDYHHEHPKPGATPGTYTFTITPNKAGQYKIFADLLPVATGQQEYAPTTFVVEGAPSTVEKTTNTTSTVDGYTFTMKFEEETFSAGHPHMAWVTVAGPDGKPFEKLEPVMGAFAHVVGFSEDRMDIAHIHPMGKEPQTADERGGPQLEFHTDFKTGGYKKLFVQVQIDGEQVFAPFGVDVLPAKADEHGQSQAHGEHGHAEGKAEIPATAAAIFDEVDEHLEQLDGVVASGKLGGVHELAFDIRDMLLALPEKATGLSPDNSKALATSLGKIKQQAGLLDKFGDAGDAAQTKVVLSKFKAEIERVKGLVGAKEASDAGAAGVVKMANNTLCPISGKPVGSMQAGASVTHAGHTVGLCCMGCEGAFKKDPDANLKKALAEADSHAK